MRLRDNCARALLPLSALLLQGVFKKSCAVEDMRGEDGEDGREHFLSMQRASISYVCSAWKCECWGVARVRTCCGCSEAFLVRAPRGSVMRTGNHIKRVSVSSYLLAVLDDHHTARPHCRRRHILCVLLLVGRVNQFDRKLHMDSHHSVPQSANHKTRNQYRSRHDRRR